MTQPAPVPTPPPGDPAPVPTPPPTPPPVADPAAPPADNPLGPAGERALAAEREANRQLRERLGALAETDVTALTALAKALGGQPSGSTQTDLERLTARMAELEATATGERAARERAEVAAAKGLNAQQAGRLHGTTREELLADADALLALFPAATPGTAAPRTPAPDPSQGARGAGTPDLDAQITAAQTAGDWQTVIALKRQKTFTT